MPPVGLMPAFMTTGRFLKPYSERLGRWITRNAREGLGWVLGAIGFRMLLGAAVSFEFFGSRIIPASAEPCALPALRPVWHRYARPRDIAFGIVRPILRISTVMRIDSVGILPCVSLSPPSAASTPAESGAW